MTTPSRSLSNLTLACADTLTRSALPSLLHHTKILRRLRHEDSTPLPAQGRWEVRSTTSRDLLRFEVESIYIDVKEAGSTLDLINLGLGSVVPSYSGCETRCLLPTVRTLRVISGQS